MTDIVERLRNTLTGSDGARQTLNEAAVEIERLRGENEVTAADLHAWMKLKAAAEACLAEAVEVLRTIVGTLDCPTGGQHVADMRSASAAARAFLAKLEGR